MALDEIAIKEITRIMKEHGLQVKVLFMLFSEFRKYLCMRIPLLYENTQVLKRSQCIQPNLLWFRKTTG